MSSPNFVIGTMVNNGREKRSVLFSIFDDGDEGSLKITRHKPIDLDTPKYVKQAIEELNAKALKTEGEITSSLVIGIPIDGNKMTYFTANQAVTGLNSLFPDIIHDNSKSLEESIGLIATRFKDMSPEQVLEYFRLDPVKVVHDVKRNNVLSVVHWQAAFAELRDDAARVAKASVQRAKMGSGFVMGLTSFFKEKIKKPFWFTKDENAAPGLMKKFLHKAAKTVITAQYSEDLFNHEPHRFAQKVSKIMLYAKRFGNYTDVSNTWIKERTYPIFYEIQANGFARPVSAKHVKEQLQKAKDGLIPMPQFDIKMGHKDEMNNFHLIPFKDLQSEFNKAPDKDGHVYSMDDILHLVRISPDPTLVIPNELKENPVTETIKDLGKTGEDFEPLQMGMP